MMPLVHFRLTPFEICRVSPLNFIPTIELVLKLRMELYSMHPIIEWPLGMGFGFHYFLNLWLPSDDFCPMIGPERVNSNSVKKLWMPHKKIRCGTSCNDG